MSRVGLILLSLVLLSNVGAKAASLRASWTQPTTNEDGTVLLDLGGCLLHYGTTSGAYSTTVDAGMAPSVVLSGLSPETEYFMAASCYDHARNTSALSDEVSALTGIDPPADVTPPTVTIIAPQDGTTVARKAWVTIEATATDDHGVSHVSVAVNGQELCVDGEAPYTCRWKVPAAKKDYVLDAVAADEAGNVSEPSVVTVTAR